MLRDVSCLQIISIHIMQVHMPLIKWAKKRLQNGGKSPPCSTLPTIACPPSFTCTRSSGIR
jgi:hypothetical protein